MTLDEARTLLGVDATANAEEVRRAYLRLVKGHRPDRDPVGFQRIRCAFDLIREPPTFLLDEGAPFTLEFVASSQSEQEAPAATPPANVTANDELSERLATLGAEGERAFVSAIGHLRQGDPESALPFIEAFLASGSGGNRGVSLVIETLGRLAQQGAVAPFVRLAGRFATYVHENQIMLSGPYAAQWIVLRELSLVATELPRFVFGLIATSVFEDEGANLAQELSLYAAREPTEARRVQRVLKARAPTLSGAYGALLIPAELFKPRFTVGWMAVLLLLFFVLRLIGGRGAKDENATSDPPRQLAPATDAQPERDDRFRVYQAIDELSSLAREHGLSDLESRLHRMRDSIAGDCTPLARELSAVVRLSRDKDVDVTYRAKTLWTEFARACPAEASQVPSP